MLHQIVRPFLLFLAGIVSSFAATAEVYPLEKLILADSSEKLQSQPASVPADVTVLADELPFLAATEFRGVVAPYFGKPITIEMVNEIVGAIAGYARRHDRLIGVTVPSQNVSTGALRLLVSVGTYKDIMVSGNRWFSRQILEERLGIKSGDQIRLSTLEEAVNWVNLNPFRRVKVLLNPVPAEPGKASLIVGVDEVRPLRATFSVDNSANEAIGKQRYSASLQAGNLWGIDHQGSYQFLTTSRPERYQAHALDYRVPLPSRHFLQVTASHSRSKPVLIPGLLNGSGRDSTVDIRYTIPLKSGDSPREMFVGTNFKRSDNDISFNLEDQSLLVRSTETDAFHLFAGITSVRRQSRGAWMFGATLFGSPGNITSRNTDDAFAGTFDFQDGVLRTARSGAQAFYFYGSAVAQRFQPLALGWDLFSRGVVQFASHNLIPSEQLTIGGSTSVRGYPDGTFSGDDGFAFNNELMSPAWRQKLPFLPKNASSIETRFLGFLDIAKVEYHERFTSDIKLGALASTGVGFRSSISNNFSMSFDYGWQLTHLPRQAGQATRPPLGSRGHIKLVLAF